MPTKPFLDHDGPIAFAHRGGASDHPENTLPAFQHAIDLGYQYLETDVHATADGVVVAFHDTTLDRVTDHIGRIAELPWSVVREAHVAGTEPIPLLEDLLMSWPEARINIDPKVDRVVEPLTEVIRRCGALDRVRITAFSGRHIARARRLLGPALCTGMGPGAITRQVLAPPRSVQADCAQVPTHAGPVTVVTERFVESAHRRGMQVHVWTIDDRAEMERLLDLGVDGVMTDRPQVLKDVLIERGQWS